MGIPQSDLVKCVLQTCSQVNVGSGADLTITELAMKIKAIVGYNGDIIFDSSKPDGTPTKFMDVSKLVKFGWTPSWTLDQGLEITYERAKHLFRFE